MPIPESQLQTWSNQGAVTSSKNTHESLRRAIDSFSNWSYDNIQYEMYLQGSYRNSTNIYGDSDVDLVVELNSVHYSNLTQEQKRQLGFSTVDYNWSKFRTDVIHALNNYYGSHLVDTSASKSIKVLPSSGRLKADVVVCVTYRYYGQIPRYIEGITFWSIPENTQITNYPKLHYENGTTKNSNTNNWYKPTVRVFKNARNRLIQLMPEYDGNFPSYFIECLLYNVPDSLYGRTYQLTFLSALNWLIEHLENNSVAEFTCQNRIDFIFGSKETQWNIQHAALFLRSLVTMWSNW